MTRDEYIESVVAGIKDKKTKAEISAEIAAHLDDRIKYYTDAGYDYDEALSQAIGIMGDGEVVSHSMSRLYKGKFGDTSTAYWFMVFGIINLATRVFASWDSYDFSDFMSFEFYGISTLLYVTATAIKNSDKKLIQYGILYQTFFIVTKAITVVHIGVKAAFTSAFLIFISSLLSGDMQAVKTVVSYNIEIISSDILVFISIILYLSVYGVILLALHFTKKTSHTHYTLRQKHIKGCTFRALICLTLVVLLIYIGFAVIDINGINNGKNDRDIIVIAECDSPIDFTSEITNDKLSDIEYNENEKIKANGKDVFLSVFSLENDIENYYEYNYINAVGEKNTSSYMTEGKMGNIKYKIKNNVLKYTPNYNYVYVFTFPSDPASAKYSFKNEYRDSNWVETNKKSEFCFSIEQGKHPVNFNHIIIEKKE